MLALSLLMLLLAPLLRSTGAEACNVLMLAIALALLLVLLALRSCWH